MSRNSEIYVDKSGLLAVLNSLICTNKRYLCVSRSRRFGKTMAARRYYKAVQECPAGKGFADIVFLPVPHHADKLALVVELKWNQEADTAIKQIKEKRYLRALE